MDLRKKNLEKRLTKLERAQFSIPINLRDVLVGLLLGDLCGQKGFDKGNTYIHFVGPTLASLRGGGTTRKALSIKIIYITLMICLRIIAARLKYLIVFLINVQVKYILVYNLLLTLYHALMKYMNFFILVGPQQKFVPSNILLF
jgi:hypothetical protein